MEAKRLLLAAVFVSLPSTAWAEMRSVRVSTANFRDGPSTRHAILYRADRYYPVEIVKCESGWCQTKDFEGDVAWVAERLLASDASVVVKVDRANVRSEPTTASKVLFEVDWGEALKVTRRQGQWLQILDIEGETGWLRGDLSWGDAPPESNAAGAQNGKKNDAAPRASEGA